MKYEYLTNTPVAQAIGMLKEQLTANGFCYKTETVKTADSLHRVTATAVYAKRSSPHYCSSAMDGIAVLAENTFGASESNPVTLNSDQFVRVDTGDVIPMNADSVIMIENVIENKDGSVRIYAAAVPWQHIRQIGEDVSMGDMLAPSFTELTPSLIGAFMAGGVLSFEAVRRPVCAIIPTGDEIVSAETTLGDGDIPEYNYAIFSAMLKQWGADSIIYETVPDHIELLKKAVTDAAEKADCVLVIAGSSAGRDDYTTTVLNECGSLVCHGVAMKPGKPTILGRIGNVPFFGLPGYPVSGITVMNTFVKPIIALLTKRILTELPTESAILSGKLISSLKYEESVRCRAAKIGDDFIAVPMRTSAGLVSGYSKSSALLSVAQNCEGYENESEIQIALRYPKWQLDTALMIVGSHDPLLDEVYDLMRKQENSCLVMSSHVGSMGGIMAVKRNQAHMGGIHLLDEESGTYNIPYLKKMFLNQKVYLIRGVGRLQGLIVKKGNPKNVTCLEQLTGGISYVNRQKGSGTRILLDYLLNRNHIDSSTIYGYEREEYTHTAVAAMVASDSADVGMGIYSAAKIYDLDFIPLWNEHYDLLVSEYAFDQPCVKLFLDVLRSHELKDRLTKLGGYTVDGIGEIINWSE